MNTWSPVSDNIRDELVNALEHEGVFYESVADAIMEKFFVVPRDQLTYKYGTADSPAHALTGDVDSVFADRAEAVREVRLMRSEGFKEAVLVQRPINLSWTIALILEDDE